MSSARGFVLGVAVVAVALSLSPCARASTLVADQAAAFAACHATIDPWRAKYPSNTWSCKVITVGPTNGTMTGSFQSVGTWDWYWPAAVCTAGKSGSSGQFDGDFFSAGKGQSCDDGCLSQFAPGGVAGVCVVGGSCSSFGSWVQTGASCTMADPALPSDPNLPSPAKISAAHPTCDGAGVSCYDPRLGYCGETESGETVCAKGAAPGDPPPDACKSGATGAVCTGSGGADPGQPSDPPIPPNSQPSHEAQVNTTPGGSGGAFSTDVKTYSGTSPGGSGGGGGSGSPGGSGSNANGGGNSGPNGTDDKGQCPDGKVPTASGCSGTYTDLGCDAPPLCYGDAVLCGIAANTHKSACNGPGKGSSSGDALKGYPAGDPMDASGDGKAGDVSEVRDVPGPGELDASGFGYSSSCPLYDQTFTVMGKSVVVPLADKCEPLSWIRYLLLACAYFVGAKIIAGVK